MVAAPGDGGKTTAEPEKIVIARVGADAATKVEGASGTVIAPMTAAGEKPAAVPAGGTGSAAVGAVNGFRISGLAACTKIEGFGKYTRTESINARSRPTPLLLYTQLDGFTHRTVGGLAAGGDENAVDWEVVIGQSVAVYRLGSDGKEDVLVRAESEQISRDVLRGKRRDHYLVQRIELPATVVGEKYRVKVTVKDKVTGAVDERCVDVGVR